MALVESVGLRTPDGFATRGAARALALLLLASSAPLAGHEGHGTPVKPVYQDVAAGEAGYRIGFAMQPPDALVGEDIRLEFHVIPAAGGSVPTPEQMSVRIVSADGASIEPRVSPGGRRGTYLVRHRFENGGQYRVTAQPGAAGQTPVADFPIVVSAGPVLRAALVVDAIVVLIIGAMLAARMRQSRSLAGRGSAGWGGTAAVGGVGLAALIVGHVWLSPTIGRMFLPERHTGNVPWETPRTTASATAFEASPATALDGRDVQDAKAPAARDHSHPPGTRPHDDGKAGARPSSPH